MDSSLQNESKKSQTDCDNWNAHYSYCVYNGWHTCNDKSSMKNEAECV